MRRFRLDAEIRTAGMTGALKWSFFMFLPMLVSLVGLAASTAHGFPWPVLATIPLLGCAYPVLLQLGRVADPSSHPARAKLAEAGLAVQHFDAEIQKNAVRRGLLLLTPEWLVYQCGDRLDVYSIKDLIWFHGTQVTETYHGFSVGQHLKVTLYMRDGSTCEVAAFPPIPEQTMETLATLAPWALAGYLPALAQAWKHGRAALVADVDRRRVELTS